MKLKKNVRPRPYFFARLQPKARNILGLINSSYAKKMFAKSVVSSRLHVLNYWA